MMDLHKLIFFMVIWLTFRFILENMRMLKYIEGYKRMSSGLSRPSGPHLLGRYRRSGVNVEHTVYDVNSYDLYCKNNPTLCNKAF